MDKDYLASLRTGAVVEVALANGWTAKEAAANSRRSIKAVQQYLSRNQLHLAYGGHGPLPSKRKASNTDKLVAKIFTQTQTQTTQTK